jgi:acyl-CoA thioester hydrolase
MSFNIPKNKTFTCIRVAKSSRRAILLSALHFSGMSDFETRIRVRYSETDQMGVVYHANYLTWMEVGRVAYCKHIGFDYKEMEEIDGVVIAVVEAQCRYLYPARFDDEIAVRLHVAESTARHLRFRYEMFRVDGEGERKVARGETSHLYLSKSEFRPIRLPDKYHAAFGVG